MQRLAHLVLLCLPLLSACTGMIGAPGDDDPLNGIDPHDPNTPTDPRDPSTPPAYCPPPIGQEATFAIMEGLAPRCVGCHGARDGSKGYFTSLDAFINLLVADESLVKPGDADGSRLVQLLEGTAPGSVSQMPLAGAPYAMLEGVTLPVSAVREWIDGLDAFSIPSEPARNASTAPRLPTRVFGRGLPNLMGISPVGTSPWQYRVRANDTLGGSDADAALYTSLGGPSALTSTVPNETVHATFTQYLGPMSLSYCGTTVANAASPLFTVATPAIGSDDVDVVKQNLADMQLLLLGEVATVAEQDRLFAEVFVPIEAAAGPERAWVASCAALLQDPRFVFY